MTQIKIVLNEAESNFVKSYSQYGFKSKTALINEAIATYRQQLREKAIAESAILYQEIYESDQELQDLTNDAASLCLE
ncbi:MAG: hypothetical protein AAF298_15750 [Cyanobacteria bacterium P01_A01_bin.40]